MSSLEWLPLRRLPLRLPLAQPSALALRAWHLLPFALRSLAHPLPLAAEYFRPAPLEPAFAMAQSAVRKRGS
jgi:hypothetical protein